MNTGLSFFAGIIAALILPFLALFVYAAITSQLDHGQRFDVAGFVFGLAFAGIIWGFFYVAFR